MPEGAVDDNFFVVHSIPTLRGLLFFLFSGLLVA